MSQLKRDRQKQDSTGSLWEGGSSSKLTLPPPQVFKYGGRRVVFANFLEIVKRYMYIHEYSELFL